MNRSRISCVQRSTPLLATFLWTVFSACSEGPRLRLEPVEQYPTRIVQVLGVPSDADPAGVVLTMDEDSDGDSWSVRLPVDTLEGGALSFRVPFHPRGLGEGGTLRVPLDGLEHEPLRLVVKPVPAAPGTTLEVVQDAAEVSRGLLRLWGVPPSAALRVLGREGVSLPPQVFFAALALHLLDDPANPSALLSVLDGRAAAVQIGAVELSAADRLLAISEIPETMRDIARTLGELVAQTVDARAPSAPGTGALPPTILPPSPLVGHLKIVDEWARSLARLASGGAFQQEGSDCEGLSARPTPDDWLGIMYSGGEASAYAMANWVKGEVEIQTVAELSCYMKRRAALESALGGLQRKVRNDIVDLVEWVPHPATAVLGVANKLLEWSLRSNLQLLPSRLDSLEVVADTIEFFEDDERTGRWGATVNAHSDKLVVNVADLLDAIMLVWDVLDLGKVAVKAGEELAERAAHERFGRELSKMTDEQVERGVDQMFSHIKLSSPSERGSMRRHTRPPPSGATRKEVDAAAQVGREEFTRGPARMSDEEMGTAVDEAFAQVTFDHAPTEASRKGRRAVSRLSDEQFKQFLETGSMPDGLSEVEAYVLNRAMEVMKWALKGAEVGSWGPYHWKDIPVNDPRYAKGSIRSRAGETPCVLIPSPLEQDYWASAAGDCLLVVELHQEEFGGVSAWDDERLVVHAIDIDVERDGQTVSPGDTITFEATVRNAVHKSVKWRSTGGSGIRLRGNRYQWTAPDLEQDRCRDIFTIEAQSTTRRGPRKSGEPPRTGSATVTVEAPSKLEIVPSDVVLGRGEEVTFTVVGEQLPDRWTADGGKIVESTSQSARYKAPESVGGPHTVKAELKGAEGAVCAESEATVLVRDCWFSANLAGAAGGIYQGAAGFSVYPNSVTLVFRNFGGYEGTVFNANFGAELAEVRAGTFSLQSGSVAEVSNEGVSYAAAFDARMGGPGGDLGGGTLLIEQASDQRLTGTLSAEFITLGSDFAPRGIDPGQTVSFDAHFSAVQGSEMDPQSEFLACIVGGG